MTNLASTDATIQGYIDLLTSRKGQIVTIQTTRAMKVRKGQDPIQKSSEFQCRVGVNYDNIQAVKDKRAEGQLPAQNAGLPWGEWVDFPYFIAHKGEYYVRCTVLRNAHRKAPTFTRLGTEITKDEAQIACLASEFREGDDNDVFTIKLAAITGLK